MYTLPRGILAILGNETVSFSEKIALFELARLTINPINSLNKALLYDTNRNKGNNYNNEKQFLLAIGSYIICLASSNQMNRGIAYANRSAAYLALKLYQDCIESGNLAKEFLLPGNVLKKVLARERVAIECLKLEKINDNSRTTELSYRRSHVAYL